MIVSDSAKLAFVGVNGGCRKGVDCPEGWSFSGDDGDEVIADAKLGIERVAFEESLPLGFSTYGLNAGRGATEPDPHLQQLQRLPAAVLHSPTAIKYATTAEKWELDTEHRRSLDLYKVLALALPGGAEKYFHGVPPSDKLLKRMFDPVDADNPEYGGLASPARLTRLMSGSSWAGTPYYKAGQGQLLLTSNTKLSQ